MTIRVSEPETVALVEQYETRQLHIDIKNISHSRMRTESVYPPLKGEKGDLPRIPEKSGAQYIIWEYYNKNAEKYKMSQLTKMNSKKIRWRREEYSETQE